MALNDVCHRNIGAHQEVNTGVFKWVVNEMIQSEHTHCGNNTLPEFVAAFTKNYSAKFYNGEENIYVLDYLSYIFIIVSIFIAFFSFSYKH